jgi:integrase
MNTNREAEKPRERTLSGEELRDIWQALRDDRYGDIVRLLILTGARREEIGGLRWPEIDLNKALITLPSDRVKSRREHRIPLAAPTLAIIDARPRENDLVFGYRAGPFADWSSQKRALDARIAAARKADGRPPMLPWHLHDIRRALSTTMHDDLGILPHIVEACLGHVQGGIAGVYNRAVYDGPKADALARWADYVLAVVEGRERKVLSLAQAS